MNNYLQKDRYKETTYLEEKSTLTLDDKGSYTEKNNQCIQNVYTGKVSIGKYSIGNNEEDIHILSNDEKVKTQIERLREAGIDEKSIQDTLDTFERFKVEITPNTFNKVFSILNNDGIYNKDGYIYEIFKREELL